LGVTPVINASVTMTFLSGSLMLPEVLEAINSTSHDFANMYELQDKVGGQNCRNAACRSGHGYIGRGMRHITGHCRLPSPVPIMKK
jgi:seryl-tRNA(Sec) selenium transferase